MKEIVSTIQRIKIKDNNWIYPEYETREVFLSNFEIVCPLGSVTYG